VLNLIYQPPTKRALVLRRLCIACASVSTSYKGFTRVTATAHKQVSGQVRSELACSPFKPGATRRFDTGHAATSA
jgi:hypothetical protein